jgi:hypothetical protein
VLNLRKWEGDKKMRDEDFRRFLVRSDSIESKSKAVSTRVSKASAVEKKLGVNLDKIVREDELVFTLLVRIQQEMKDLNGGYQNAVRKYYAYVNGKEFPRLKEYARG